MNATTILTIQEAITRHAGNLEWARLSDVRAEMDTYLDLTREQQDKILRTLSRERRVHIAPDSNRKALVDADHAAAIRIGGQDNHLIALG